MMLPPGYINPYVSARLERAFDGRYNARRWAEGEVIVEFGHGDTERKGYVVPHEAEDLALLLLSAAEEARR